MNIPLGWICLVFYLRLMREQVEERIVVALLEDESIASEREDAERERYVRRIARTAVGALCREDV